MDGEVFFSWAVEGGEGQSQKSTGQGDFPVILIVFAGQAENPPLITVQGKFHAGQGAHP